MSLQGIDNPAVAAAAKSAAALAEMQSRRTVAVEAAGSTQIAADRAARAEAEQTMREEAAIRIQALRRGSLARKSVMERREAAAMNAWREEQERRRDAEELERSRRAWEDERLRHARNQEKAAIRIQALRRGSLARRSIDQGSKDASRKSIEPPDPPQAPLENEVGWGRFAKAWPRSPSGDRQAKLAEAMARCAALEERLSKQVKTDSALSQAMARCSELEAQLVQKDGRHASHSPLAPENIKYPAHRFSDAASPQPVVAATPDLLTTRSNLEDLSTNASPDSARGRTTDNSRPAFHEAARLIHGIRLPRN